jgi:hypothetical protein
VQNTECKSKASITTGTVFNKPAIKLSEYLKIVFMCVSGFDTVQTEQHINVSISTAFKIRDVIINK